MPAPVQRQSAGRATDAIAALLAVLLVGLIVFGVG
jgi:hypothetical protein